ncbi:hypothetical protein [Arthrobacter sp. H14]|uniref:hypothetical protein n=1 Tax=Arthrobacter sp. H14 TaxID=1312959 RepID=UPI00047DAE05|nr:hypothetical protein [Arthrobacter sp. H14]
MAVVAIYETTISCDGLDASCPVSSTLITGFAPAKSVRKAVRAGWQITDEVLCPACAGSIVPLPAPAPVGVPQESGAQLVNPRLSLVRRPRRSGSSRQLDLMPV